MCYLVSFCFFFFFFKQKTAYEMRISDWSSDVCSSDLGHASGGADRAEYNRQTDFEIERIRDFLILHYHANARPEPLWQACRAMALPDSLAAKIALFAENGQIVREHEELFTEVGWLQVLIGQGINPKGYHTKIGRAH